MKKLKPEVLWLAIRLHLIFEIIRYHERTVTILKKSKGQANVIADLLEQQVTKVSFSIQRIKEMPSPADLNYLCFLMKKRESCNSQIGSLKYDLAEGFFTEMFSEFDMKRRLQDLLHPCSHLKYFSDEKIGVIIESGKETILVISRKNELKFPGPNTSASFFAFLNRIFVSGNVLDQDAFEKVNFDDIINESIHEKIETQ